MPPKRKTRKTTKTTVRKKRKTTNMSLTGGTGDVNPQFVTTIMEFPRATTTNTAGEAYVLKWNKTEIFTFPGTVLTTSAMQTKVLVPEVLSIEYTYYPPFDPKYFVSADPALSTSTNTSSKVTIASGDRRTTFGPDIIGVTTEFPTNQTENFADETDLFIKNKVPIPSLIDTTFWRQEVHKRGINVAPNQEYEIDNLRELDDKITVDLTDNAGHGLVSFSNVLTINFKVKIDDLFDEIIRQYEGFSMIVRVFYRLKKISLQELLVGQQTFAVQ